MKFKIQYLFVNNFFNLLQLKTFYWIFPASIQNVCKKLINWNLDSKLEKNVLKIEEVKLVLDSRYFKTNWCIFLNCSLPYKCFKSFIRNKKWRKEWQNLLHIVQIKEPRSNRASHRSDTLKEKEKAPKDIEKSIECTVTHWLDFTLDVCSPNLTPILWWNSLYIFWLKM